MDRSSYQVQAMQRMGFLQIPVAVDYPYAPKITSLNDANPIVNRLNEVGFFFVNELTRTGDTSRVAYQSLMRTSENTGILRPDPQTGMVNISVGQEFPDYLFQDGSKDISATLEGEYSSYFGDMRPDTISYPDEHLSTSIIPTALVAVGNSTFTNQQFMVQPSLTFLLNAVDWLYDRNGLISIRSKNVQPTQLDEMSSGTRQMLKWINILLAPVLLVLIGVLRWMMRKKVKTMAGVK